jgi:hypothetical protein
MTTKKTGGPAGDGKKPPHPESIRYSYFSIDDEIVPPDFILPGLEIGQVGLIFAPGGTGKSFLLMELALAVASGKSLIPSFPPNVAGPVKGLFFELNDRALRNRMTSILRAFPEGEAGLERLFLAPLLGEHLYLLSADGDPNEKAINWLQEQCDGMTLLILDPLRRCHAADENNNAAMDRLIEILMRIGQRTGTGILAAHHSSKASILNGQGSLQQSGRGASALADGARLVITLSTRPSEDDDDPQNCQVSLSVAKINEHPPINDIILRRGPGGVFLDMAEEKDEPWPHVSSPSFQRKGGRYR